MAFHTLAYAGTSGSPDFASLTAVADPVIFVSQAGNFVLPKAMHLLGGYGGGSLMTGARVSAASSFVSPEHVQPFEGSLQAPSDPNLMVLPQDPLKLHGQEDIIFESRAASSADPAVGLIWVCDEVEEIPAGDSYWIRWTGTSAAGAVNTWKGLTGFP